MLDQFVHHPARSGLLRPDDKKVWSGQFRLARYGLSAWQRSIPVSHHTPSLACMACVDTQRKRAAITGYSLLNSSDEAVEFELG